MLARFFSWVLAWLAPSRGFVAAVPVAAPTLPARAERVTTRAGLEVMADGAAARYAIPAAIFKGLVAQESGWNPSAIRQEPAIGDASRGLTLVLLRTAEGEGYAGTADGLLDPWTNLNIGASYLARLFRRFGSWQSALAAYNGGPAAGVPVTVPTTVVLARDQVTGAPVRTFTAQPGQYRTQPYVDSVLTRAAGYGLTLAGLSGSTGLLLALGLLSGLAVRWFKARG